MSEAASTEGKVLVVKQGTGIVKITMVKALTTLAVHRPNAPREYQGISASFAPCTCWTICLWCLDTEMGEVDAQVVDSLAFSRRTQVKAHVRNVRLAIMVLAETSVVHTK